jgi:cytochrome c oxidase assembly protein subunit 15
MARRPVFEEVSETRPSETVAPQAGLIDRGGQGGRGPIRVWLAILFVMVMAMIIVGGLTRLTDSGLSITEWKPVTGAIPPMNAADWQSEFDKYREIPEYQLQNKGMSLSEFKVIYWWEWGHRFLGRMVGLVWAVGFFWFLARKQIPRGWTGRLVGLGALGGLQGAIGWWMVSSGLSGEMLDVASYRLATHLGLAFVILGLIAWYFLSLGRRDVDLMQARRAGDKRLFGMSTGMMHFAFLQILLGALVAGIDAGRTYTDWPLMAGGFFPPDMFSLSPWWRNFFEEPGLVQLMHRLSGYGLFIYGLALWRVSRGNGNVATKRSFDWMAVLLFGQLVLGIGTVLYAAPVGLAIAHQALAVMLWVSILNARFNARYPAAQSVRG